MDKARLAELKATAEQRCGSKPKWSDNPAGSVGYLGTDTTISVLLDPPPGTPNVSGWGPGWPDDGSQECVLQDMPLPMAESKVDKTPLGAIVTGDLTFEEWQAEVKGLFRIGKALPWIVGDLLNYGEAQYGEQYAQVLAVAETLDYSVSTVQQWKSVSGRVPMSERTEDVSWSCWRYLASKTPEERKAGLEAYADGATTDDVKALLEEPAEQEQPQRPPCPICGGETTATRCKACAADFSAVCWHLAETTPLEQARRLTEVKALVEAARAMRRFELYEPRNTPEFVALYAALVPFEEE